MKNKSYNIFRQKIHKSADKNKFPLRVMFELTYRCNFSCRHCYVPSSYKEKAGKRELKTQEIFSLLNQLKDMGCFYLGFTGGEPFIRKDIMEILRHAKRCGFELIIYTNGSLINRKIANQLVRLRLNKVDITIPAMSKDVFENISGVPGSRDMVFRAIDLLHKKGVNLGFKTCVLKENEQEIGKIQDFAASLSVPHRLDDMLLPRLDGSKEPYKYRGRPPSSRTRDYGEPRMTAAVVPHAGLWRAKKTRRKRNLIDCDSAVSRRTPAPGSLFKCGVGVSQAAITPSGELKMCVMIDYPKYKIQTTDDRQQTTGCGLQKINLKDAWLKLKALVASIKPGKYYKCDKCELEPDCKWCPAKGWLENRNFTSCDPENRSRAETRR